MFDAEILPSRRYSDVIHWLRDPLEELVVRVEKNFQLNVLLHEVKKTTGSPAPSCVQRISSPKIKFFGLSYTMSCGIFFVDWCRRLILENTNVGLINNTIVSEYAAATWEAIIDAVSNLKRKCSRRRKEKYLRLKSKKDNEVERELGWPESLFRNHV